MGSMAEEESDIESERLKEELESLLEINESVDRIQHSKIYCYKFLELVEEHTGRWQVPLPQLQVLQIALCYFTHGTARFPPDCEQVQFTLSSLALSFFELLLFFGKDEFLEDPLKDILESFQDCLISLARHKNQFVLLVNQIIKDGGPWENPVLRDILQESVRTQEEVNRYLSSELPVFFELRVRYLLACERLMEAVALSKCCIHHPDFGQQIYFHQVHLTCLWKASLHDRLQKEIAQIDGKEAIKIICNTEKKEKDDLLLALSRAFVVQQLQSGDMYYIWDLVFIWSKLHLRVKRSKQDFLEECRQLLLLATNMKSIFPFLKVVRDELGTDGLHFCVELCARALETDLHHEPDTKSLLYKAIAYLLPSDLEVCRACALLVFFLERTVESYKTVYLLYTHPDQEYHVDCGLIKNDIRFEILQILKKGLFFDPEFWNLIALRKHCLKLMSEKDALSEMQEDQWVSNSCVKEPCKIISWSDYNSKRAVKHNGENRTEQKAKSDSVPLQVNSDAPIKRRGRKPGSRIIRVVDGSKLRRSFRQLYKSRENDNDEHDSRQQRYSNRQVEKTLKRRGRKPRWLLEEMARKMCNINSRHQIYPGKKSKLLSTETKLSDSETKQTGFQDQKVGDFHLECQQTTKSSSDDIRQHLDNTVTPSCVLEVLEISYPENEIEDLFSIHQKVKDSTYEVTVTLKDIPLEQAITKTLEREILLHADLQSCLEFPATSEVMGEKHGQGPVFNVDSATIEEWHNYSKSPMDPTEVSPELVDTHSKMEQTSGELVVITVVEEGKSSQLSTEHLTSHFGDCQQGGTSKVIKDKNEGSVHPQVNDHLASRCQISDEDQLPVNTINVSDKTSTVVNGVKESGDSRKVTDIYNDSSISYIGSDVCVPSETICIQTASLSKTGLPLNSIDSESEKASEEYVAFVGQKINILKHHCRKCNKDFKGGNIMRHAVAHLQRDNLRCIFCGKRFRRRLVAKQHVVEHFEILKAQTFSENNEFLNIVSIGDSHVSGNRNHPEDSELKSNGSTMYEKAQIEAREYRCPAEGCRKKFIRKELSMIQHAMKSHPSDVKVHDYVFSLMKNKCHFCKRNLQSLPHYQDHISVHNHPLKHACLHHDCKIRFKTQKELKEHIKSHQPLEAHCSFEGCTLRFSQLGKLFSHELGHYPPTETKNEDRQTEVSIVWENEKPEDFWEDTGRYTVQPKTYVPGRVGRVVPNDADVQNEEQVSPDVQSGEQPLSAECIDQTDDVLPNGHGINSEETFEARLEPTEAQLEHLPEKEHESQLVVNQKSQDVPGCTELPQEPALQATKPNDAGDPSTSSPTIKTFIRPPPSAYLDEKFLSMPKRRTAAGTPCPIPAKLKNTGQRQRCTKCFSSFSSPEELKTHLELNKCNNLFGFDSDEEDGF